MGIELHPFDTVSAVAVLAAAACLYLLFSAGARRPFAVWRGAAVLLLLALAFQPELVRPARDRRPLLAVAADVSGSMKLSGMVSSAEYFIRKARPELEKDFRLEWYAFASGAEPLEAPHDLRLRDCGTATDISRSLREIRREGGERLVGILLLSDGNHTGPPPPENWLSGLDVPVFTAAPGTERKIRDLAVSSLRASDFAFKNTPLEIIARVRASGCAGEKTAVNLRQLEPVEKIVSSRPLAVASDADEQEVALSVTPDASGSFRYRVEVVPLKGELSRANNRKDLDLEVVRDKIRVLYICGQPGPEYAFLRHALKNDPLVELVSFVILRNPENIALVPENDLSLIPFPVHTIFMRDLYDFDLLIFENFSYRPFGFLPDYLRSVQRWVVEKGGGLLMIAGNNSFGGGGWNATAVGEILPAAGAEQGERFDDSPFRMKAAEPSHPLMRLSDDPSKNEAAWREMPELEGLQLLEPRAGAEVVATHPWNGKPVIAVWEKGRGRVMALASDTTWRWALQSPTPERYTRFWRNAVRYLSKAGQEKRVKAQFDRSEYAAGQRFTLRLRENDRAPGRQARVTMTDPSGRQAALPARRAGDGAWDVEGVFSESGEHRFSISLEKDGVRVFGDTVKLAVMPSLSLEEAALDTNETFLKQVAEASNGEYFPAGAISRERIAARVKRAKKEEGSRRAALWDSPALLGLLAASFLAEWYLRRRKGLP